MAEFVSQPTSARLSPSLSMQVSLADCARERELRRVYLEERKAVVQEELAERRERLEADRARRRAEEEEARRRQLEVDEAGMLRVPSVEYVARTTSQLTAVSSALNRPGGHMPDASLRRVYVERERPGDSLIAFARPPTSTPPAVPMNARTLLR